MTTITAQDGSGDSTSPIAISGWSASSESRNRVHDLIAPGQIAVTLVGDLPRAGSLELSYTDDAALQAARQLLGRPTSFALTRPDRDVVEMTFVRVGTMTESMNPNIPTLWALSVGYQEIEP